MACLLTQGFTLDCRDGIGGIKEVYIIELANVSSYTESSGTVSAITKTTGSKFRKYQLNRETSNATENITGSETNGTLFYTQNVTIVINKRNATIRNEIMLLAKNNVVIVTGENSGRYFLYGRTQGLQLVTGESGTGTAWGDRNGSSLPFAGNETELAPEVTSECAATLETPG